MISIQNLSKKYGSKVVLERVNLDFAPGNVYGIVGENGAGKTTLFKCIASFESFEGTIDTSIKPLKSRLGYLPTNPIFMKYITGWEYLKLLTLARGLDQKDFEKRNIFNLPLDEYVTNYSTGMQKKLALLGILFQENEVLILDEPFNGVDINSNMMISSIIHKLKELNKTVLISSHIFATLKDICDQIIYLKNHTIEEIVSKQNFNELQNSMVNDLDQTLISKLNLQ